MLKKESKKEEEVKEEDLGLSGVSKLSLGRCAKVEKASECNYKLCGERVQLSDENGNSHYVSKKEFDEHYKVLKEPERALV